MLFGRSFTLAANGMKLHVSCGLRDRLSRTERKYQTDRSPPNTNNTAIAGSFGYKQGFKLNFKNKISCHTIIQL